MEYPDIDGLTFIRKLGSGGFADVYLYQQAAPRRQVAVKVRRDRTLGAGTMSLEADFLARLAHPHIVPIYQTGTTDAGFEYIVMMYYPATVADRLRERPYSVPEALRWGCNWRGR